MEILQTIFASSRIIYLILVPALRGISGILFAFAISKDCKSRDNGSSALWGLFALISPMLAGIIYFIYSRFLVSRKPQTIKDKKHAIKSKLLIIWAVLFYISALIIGGVSFMTSAASGIAAIISDDGTQINSYKYDEYYDMNGRKYEKGEDVILYDTEGKSYHIEEDPDGWNYYPYFDENGKSYDLDKSYISKEGFFYFDENDSLIPDRDGMFVFEYDKIFHDEEGNEYRKIGNFAFFDKDGKVVTNHPSGHTSINEYAF